MSHDMTLQLGTFVTLALTALSGCQAPATGVYSPSGASLRSMTTPMPYAVGPTTAAPSLAPAASLLALAAGRTTMALGEEPVAAMPVQTLAMDPVFTAVLHSSTVRHDALFALHSQADVDRAMREIAPGQRRLVTRIDFQTRQGVLIALGPQKTGMIKVQVANILDAGAELVVQAVRILPRTPYPTMDMGWPVALVTLERSEKPLVLAPIQDRRI